jgi:hypothetical protein
VKGVEFDEAFVAELIEASRFWTFELLYTGQGVKNLDDQDLFGIKNRGIPRAIGLRFVVWWARLSISSHLKTDTHIIKLSY